MTSLFVCRLTHCAVTPIAYLQHTVNTNKTCINNMLIMRLKNYIVRQLYYKVTSHNACIIYNSKKECYLLLCTNATRNNISLKVGLDRHIKSIQFPQNIKRVHCISSYP